MLNHKYDCKQHCTMNQIIKILAGWF